MWKQIIYNDEIFNYSVNENGNIRNDATSFVFEAKRKEKWVL